MQNSGETRALRVVVLDDEPLVLSSIVMLLESMGHNVVSLEDGTQLLNAASSAEAASFELGILDLNVRRGPGGSEVAQVLLHRCPGIKLVVTSGFPIDPVMLNFSDYGFAAKLEKPFRLRDLSIVIEQLFSKPE